MGKRLAYIDNLRAVCLALMIMGHAGLTLVEKNVIYSFHMPVFFFLSGMLYHGTGPSAWRYIGRKAFRLLLPYCIWVLVFYFAAYIWKDAPAPKTLNYAFFYAIGIQGGGGALWFLTALFWTAVLAVVRHKLRIPAWLWLVIAFVPWWISIEYKLRPWLGINMGGSFFFTLGELCNGMSSWLDKQKLSKMKWTLAGVGLAAVYCAGMVLGGFPDREAINIAYMNHNPGALVAACTACVALIIIFHALPRWRWFEKMAHYITSHAIIIVATHLVPILVAKHYHLSSHFTHWEYIGILMLLEVVWLVPVTFVLGRYLPFLNGKTYTTD